MGILKDKTFLNILLASLLIRLLLAFLPGFKIDMGDWFAWAIRLSGGGLSNFYSKDVFTDYTPGYLYILALLGFLMEKFNIDQTSFLYILKLPAILSEILIGALIYYESLKHTDKRRALILSSLVLFNPALIFNSAIWGQIDGLLTLFILLSVLMINNKKLALASICFSLAFLIKPQAISIAPIFILYLFRDFSFSNLFKLLVPAVVTLFISSAPFFTNPLFGLFNRIFETSNQYQYTSLFAYNVWGVYGFWINDLQKIGFFSLQQYGILLFIIYWILLTYLYIKRVINIYSLAFLASMSFYFLPTRVHERYLYPSLVLFVLSMTNLKTKLLNIFYYLISFLHFVNLYFVYVYYNEIYFRMPRLFYFNPIYNFINENGKELSIFSVLVFILTTYIVIKKSYVQKSG